MDLFSRSLCLAVHLCLSFALASCVAHIADRGSLRTRRGSFGSPRSLAFAFCLSQVCARLLIARITRTLWIASLLPLFGCGSFRTSRIIITGSLRISRILSAHGSYHLSLRTSRASRTRSRTASRFAPLVRFLAFAHHTRGWTRVYLRLMDHLCLAPLVCGLSHSSFCRAHSPRLRIVCTPRSRVCLWIAPRTFYASHVLPLHAPHTGSACTLGLHGSTWFTHASAFYHCLVRTYSLRVLYGSPLDLVHSPRFLSSFALSFCTWFSLWLRARSRSDLINSRIVFAHLAFADHSFSAFISRAALFISLRITWFYLVYINIARIVCIYTRSAFIVWFCLVRRVLVWIVLPRFLFAFTLDLWFSSFADRVFLSRFASPLRLAVPHVRSRYAHLTPHLRFTRLLHHTRTHAPDPLSGSDHWISSPHTSILTHA